ncbi:hypothetical protein EMIT051CA3_30756 [Pseudomonas chlororaphis]
MLSLSTLEKSPRRGWLYGLSVERIHSGLSWLSVDNYISLAILEATDGSHTSPQERH